MATAGGEASMRIRDRLTSGNRPNAAEGHGGSCRASEPENGQGTANEVPQREGEAGRVDEFELNGTFLGRYDDRDPFEGRALHSTLACEQGRQGSELIVEPIGVSDALVPFHFLRTGDRLGRAVVKLLRGDGAAGTGFLAAPGVLLTNHHVLPDPEAAAATVALANFEAAPPGLIAGKPASVPLDPDDLFVTNAELDFTFCGVKGLDFLGSIPLGRDSRSVASAETVNIIQHPRGRPKEVALRDNRVVKADHVVIHYACSTEPGSSGSPVFNNDWETVALHHASVTADGIGGRPLGDTSDCHSTIRYLNEGVRISAIALWLETAEANAPELREQAARLRAIFGGIDPRVGFFGALGRKAHGKSAPAVVVESYRGDTEDLDLAFWNVRGLDVIFHDQAPEIAGAIAEMGMDLWCLAHAAPDLVEQLRRQLETGFGLAYEVFHVPAVPSSLAVLYRRGKGLVIEPRSWSVDMPEGVELPPLVTVRASTKRSGPVAFQLVPVGPLHPVGVPAPPYAEAIRQAIRQGLTEFDWIITGDAAPLLSPERLHVLADCDRDLLAAAADRDGAVALLIGPRSKVVQVFTSPNLRPAFGVPEILSVAFDRALPPLLRSFGGHQPIALRLVLDPAPKPRPAPPTSRPLVPLNPPDQQPALRLNDQELETRIRDILTPILAKLLAEARVCGG
jgi:V8-like Glu-specific endopeptidase